MGLGGHAGVTSRFSLRGLLVGEGQGGSALLHPPVTFVLVLRLGVKESRVQVGPRVDADGFVCALVGEGHRFGGARLSNAHCTGPPRKWGVGEGGVQNQCEEPMKTIILEV